MPHRYLSILFLGATFALVIFSCKKNNDDNPEIFYGKWKTSYGDTVRFYHENGKDLLYNDHGGSPAPPADPVREYFYKQGRLSVKEAMGTGTIVRPLPSFKWLNEGKEFTMQAGDWFLYISTIGAVYTFTKID